MIKRVITMDEEDFGTLMGAIGGITYEVDHMEDSHRKGRLKRYLEEIEGVLGIEPRPIPEAITAKWSVWYNALYHSKTLTCNNCGYRHDLAIDTSDGLSGIPTVCPQCKAVMTGVE